MNADPGVIDTLHLFRPLHRHLTALVGGLTDDDWTRPTVAGVWQVRDVAAHMLDTQLRRLSFQRDGHPPPAPQGGLVGWLNELNGSWVRVWRRTSPRVLRERLEAVGAEYAAWAEGLDPQADALFPVAWAGEDRSRLWMDMGRDYTEYWHHQAQIRAAVGADEGVLLDRALGHPFLALSMRAVPQALSRSTSGMGDGARVDVTVTGPAGGSWMVVRSGGTWQLSDGGDPGASKPHAPSAAARVTMDGATAWRLFFNALGLAEARSRVATDGDRRLVDAVLSARSVMV